MKTATINLQNFRTPGARIFTGRDRGVQVRKDSHLDELTESNEKIIIQIPTDIITINPSFLEEFFKNVVQKLGKERFFDKFTFDNDGEYKIEPNLNTAIDRILRKFNALSQ